MCGLKARTVSTHIFGQRDFPLLVLSSQMQSADHDHTLAAGEKNRHFSISSTLFEKIKGGKIDPRLPPRLRPYEVITIGT